MARKLRARLAAFFTVLLFWQAGLAPFAHAALFHASPDRAASVPAEAHSADAHIQVAPCHGDAGTQAAVVSHEHAGHDMPLNDVAMAESVNPPAAPAPDCCESLACQCACVHASLGAAAVALVLPLIPDHPATLGTDAPSLAVRTAELFRPPI